MRRKSDKIIKDMIYGTLPRIEVKPGIIRYNLKCQMNAVHDALEDGDDAVAMCFCIDNGIPIIHFLNIDSHGRYVDNTLGQWSQKNEYYLIKRIDKSEFFSIDYIFSSYRNYLKSLLPFYIRWFCDCEF